MTHTARTALAVAVLIAVGACDRTAAPAAPATTAPATAPAAPAPSPQDEGGLVIEAEGLRLFDASGSARAIPFETAQAAVIAAVSAATGGAAPVVNTNEECGAGATQFAQYEDGLQLAFQDGKFAGWFLDAPGLTTADGIGVGSTRAALDESGTVVIDTDSTLGIEFSQGDLGGFLTADGAAGTVESLYAGLTCFFR